MSGGLLQLAKRVKTRPGVITGFPAGPGQVQLVNPARQPVEHQERRLEGGFVVGLQARENRLGALTLALDEDRRHPALAGRQVVLISLESQLLDVDRLVKLHHEPHRGRPGPAAVLAPDRNDPGRFRVRLDPEVQDV